MPKLTPDQIDQIKLQIEHDIDLKPLRDWVRSIWPEAKAIEVHVDVEYDDGSSYYQRCSSVTVLGEEGEVGAASPGQALSHEHALRDLRRLISVGGAVSPEDDTPPPFIIQLDNPTLDDLHYT